MNMTFDEYVEALEKIQVPDHLKGKSGSKGFEWFVEQVMELRKQLNPEDLEKVLEAERNYKKKKKTKVKSVFGNSKRIF